MIRLSSGNPVRTDKQGRQVFGNSKAHTILLLLLFCRPEQEADKDEVSSPWQDRPEVKSGRKSKADYVREICEDIDLVPAEVIELVVGELLDSGRKTKPSLGEMQALCRAAMEMKAEANSIKQESASPTKGTDVDDDPIAKMEREYHLGYWAIVHYGCKPVGSTIDWYPEEVEKARSAMERKGAKTYGPFAQREEAWAVAQQKLKEWCDSRNARSGN